MATEAYIQESVCLKKGEREENALTSESFEEKVTELPGNQVKQLETSSQVAETVNTPLEAGKPTDESGIFFQALSAPMVIADEHSNTPESWKAAKQTDPEEETIKTEEKAIESEVCEEGALEKAEPEVGSKVFDNVMPSKKEALNMLVKNQVDGDGVTSSQDAAYEVTKEATEEHATIVADFKEQDLNETPREFVKEATDDKSVDAQEVNEQCETGSKNIEVQKSEESVKKIEQDEEIEEIKPVVEMKKREQTGLLQAITTDACISTQTISQEETTEHEEKGQDVNVLEKDQDEDDVTRAQEVTFDGGLQEKIHHNEDDEHEVVKAEGTDVCISTQTALVKESIKNEEPDDQKAIEKEVCEEDVPKKAELEGGLEISDSKTPNQKETISTIEKDQGDSGGVKTSQEPPCVDVEETTTVQHIPTAIDFKEQDLNEKPREFIKEETGDKSLDAQEASEECERGTKEEIDQTPEESVKKIEKKEETEEIKPGVEIEEKKEQNEFFPSITPDVCITTQTKSQVEETEHEEEDTQNDDGLKEKSDSPSIKEVCEETGPEKDEYEKDVKDSAIETVIKDENEDEEKEQEVKVSKTDEGKNDVTSAQDVTFEKDLQEKNQHNEDDEREVVTAAESIEKYTESIRSSEKTEQQMLINVIPSDVCISTQTEPEEETAEKNDGEAIERDGGQTNRTEEGLLLSDHSSMALNENETVRKEEDQEKEQEIYISENVQSGGDYVTSSENASNEQEQHTKEIKPSVETTEENDVCISTHIESQENATKNEENAITNDGDQKEKSDNPFVNEVCEDNDLKKTEAEEEVKLSDSPVVTTREGIDEATEETKSSDETTKNMEQEGVLNVITTDVCSSTQTEYKEKITESEENNNEETIDKDDGQTKKPESPLAEVVCEATSSDMAESEGVKHPDSSSMTLNENETLSKEENLEKEDEIKTSEVQGGGDDVISSQNASGKDIKETTDQQDTSVAYIEGQGEIAMPKEILIEEAEEKSLDAKEISLQHGQPNEQNVEEAHPCLSKTISENPEDDIKKEDEDLSHESVKDTNEDSTKEQKCALEQQAVEDHSDRDEVSKEKVIDLIETTKVEPQEEITPSTLVEISTEDTPNSEKEKAESENLPTKDLEAVSEVQIHELVPKSEDSMLKEECFISETETHLDDEKSTVTNDISSAEKTEVLDDGDNVTSSQNASNEDLQETTIRQHDTTVTCVKEGQGVSATPKEILIEEAEEKSSDAKEETEQYTGGDKSEQKPEEYTDDIKPSVETNEEKDVCISTQNGSQEEPTKNEENAIERDRDRQEKLDNPFIKEVCVDLTIESEEKQLSGSSEEPTKEGVDKCSEETKSSDEPKEDMGTVICSSTPTENIEKTTVNEENNNVETAEDDDVQTEKPESPLVEVVCEAMRSESVESEEGVKHSDSFSTTLNENQTLSKEEKLEKEDTIQTSEVQGGGDEVTSSQNASNEDIKETTIGQRNTTVAYVEERQGVSAMPKDILVEESKEKSFNDEEMLLEHGQPNEQNVEETHPCVSKTINENPEDEIKKEERDLSHENVEDTNDNTAKEEKCTLEHEPVEEHSGRDLNKTTEVGLQEEIAPSVSLESSTEDTLLSEKEKPESETLPIEDLETVSEVQVPNLVLKSEEPMLKEGFFVSETETHLDEEKGTIMEEILSDEKTQQTTEIKQETVKEVCEETSSEKAEFGVKIYDNSNKKIDEIEITTSKEDDQEKDHEVNMSTESQGKDNVTSSENEASEEKEDLQEKNYHSEGNFIESGDGADEDTLEIKSSVETKENTKHVIITSSSTQIERDAETIEKEEKNDEKSIENDENETVSREENLEKEQENINETDAGEHATTVAHFKEGQSLSTMTKEVLGEAEAGDKSAIAQEITEQYHDGENDEREQKPEEHIDEIKPGVEMNEEKNVCISTQNESPEEPTKNEENVIERDCDRKENLESPFVKEACEESDLTKIESEVGAKHNDSFSTTLNENERLSKEEELEKEDKINTSEVQGGGDEVTSSQNESSDDIKETTIGEHNTTVPYVEEGQGVSAMPKEILIEGAEDKSIDDKEISLELGQPSEQNVEIHPSLSKSISENPEDEIKKEDKELSHESVEDTNEDITKEENCTLEHEPVEEHRGQDEVSKEKVTDLTETTEVEPQEDITPPVSLETSAENSKKEKAEIKNFPIEDIETVSEVLIPELVPKSEESELKEGCFISEAETRFEEEKGTITEEISSDEKKEQTTTIEQEIVKEVCEETSSKNAEFEGVKPFDTSNVEINERGIQSFKVDEQEKDQEINMAVESQLKENVTRSQNEASKAKEDLQEKNDRNEGNDGDFINSGEGVDEDTEEIKSNVETKVNTEHVITTNVCSSTQIEPNEETSQKNGEKAIENDENEIMCGEENLKERLEDVCISAQTKHKEETIENKDSGEEAVENDDGQMNPENHEKEQEPEFSGLQGGRDDVVCSQNESSEDTKETAIGQHATTTVHFEEGLGVNAITKEIMGEEVEDKSINAQEAREQCEDEAKDKIEHQPIESVNTPVNSCSEAIEGSINEEADAGNKEIKSELEAENQAGRTEDKTDMKDEAVLTEKVSNEFGQNKEQNIEEIEACLTETISEKTEDKITKDEDLSHDSIQHINENITKEKCFPDVITKEIEISALEHKPVEEQTDSQDEVSKETLTDLNETTVEPQEDITPSSSLETSAEDTSNSDKEKAVSGNLPKDLESVSEVHIPEVMPKSEDLKTKEECLISATAMYVDEELGTVTKEISSDENLETHGSTQQPENSYSTTEENVTQLEQIGDVSSHYENRDMKGDVTQNNQLNSTEDCSEMEKGVILTEEIEQVPLETEKEKGIDDFKEQIVDKDSYSLELDEKSAQNQKEIAHEISYSELILAENPEVKEVIVDRHIGQEDTQDKEDISCVTKVNNDRVDEEPKEEKIPSLKDDATVESVDLSNIESTAYPSSEKLATQALESDCDVQIPEAVADSKDSKVKEDCIVLATTDENNVEEQDTKSNEISSAPDKEQEIVTKAPTKSDEAKNRDLIIEEKALTKENFEIHGELKPMSEPVIEEDQLTIETKPQPEQSDVTSENITNDQTLESKLEHTGVKDLEDRKGHMEEDVTLAPENEAKSIENLNETTKNIILTDEVAGETEKEKEINGIGGQVSEKDNCPNEVDSTSTPDQNELANEQVEYSKPIPVGNTEVTEVKAESQIEVENIHAAEDLRCLSKADQTITVIGEVKDENIDDASREKINPALEDSKASELQVNLPEIESTDIPLNGQIQRSNSRPDELLETKESVEDTEDAKFMADNLNVKNETLTVNKGPNEDNEIVTSAFQRLEDTMIDKAKETPDEPQADDSEKTTNESIFSCTEQDIVVRSEESRDHGDMLKLEEKPTGDSEIATEVAEIVPECREASTILRDNLPEASPKMLLAKHEDKITEEPEVLSSVEKDDVDVEKHEKDLDLDTKEATPEINSQENQIAQKKATNENIEAAIPVEDVKTITREPQVRSVDLEVPSIVDATADNTINKTLEVHEAGGLLKDDEHLESTCESKPIEEGSGMTQKPLELNASVTLGTTATEDLNISQKYVADDLVKVSQTHPEIQKYEVAACTVDKQTPNEPHPKESTESKILTEKTDSSHEQGERIAKSLTPEAENLVANTASGTEPHSNTVFIDQKQSESVEPAKTVLHEPAKGNSEVAGNLIGERDSALIKDQQVEKEETGVKTDEEDEEEEDHEDDEKMGSCSDAPVMVEASKDMEVKAHKKSHNILSGVGSKVKHSIAKVKKAITGKSSPTKPPSPKAKDQVTG